jgi:hypothetical protein
MNTRAWICMCFGIFMMGAVGLATAAMAGHKASPPASKFRTRAGRYQLSGPCICDNLTVFLIHGKDRLVGKTFLTLPEALAQKKAIVHETQNVNELTMENLSPDSEILVLSGDIVKGGQQDRTIAYDIVLAPKSGKVAVAAYCVESGRWSARGRESVSTFESSPNQLASKEAKIALKGSPAIRGGLGGALSGLGGLGGGLGSAQSAVWMQVARQQMMLSTSLGKSVRSAQSTSSLELSLEDRRLLRKVEQTTRSLSKIIDNKSDVIGYAFAINGEVNSADVYASHNLFVKLWPRLLKATVIEAIADQQKGKKVSPCKVEAVKAFLLEAGKGKTSTTKVSQRIRLIRRENKKTILFSTEDLSTGKGHAAVSLRENYIKK